MNTIYVYHHNDHDGIVAAGVMYNYLMDEGILDDAMSIIFKMIDYNMELNFDHIDFEHFDEVYFLDYSFSNKHNRDEFEKLLKKRIHGDEVVWIDHHKTSIGVFEEYNIPGIRKEGLCGAAWTYLFYNEEYTKPELLEDSNIFSDLHKSSLIPTFLKYIDDYDCWKKLYPVTNDFHYGFTVSHPTDAIIYNLLGSSFGIDKIIFAGEKIQEYLKFNDKEYHVDMYGFEYTLPEEHGGYKCFCLNRKGNSLMFGNKVKEYDAVIPFYYVDGKWKYSMFTEKNNVDCEAVAKSYGGGGHPKAAGWVIDNLIFENAANS